MWQLQAVIIAPAPAPMETDVFTFTKVHNIFFLLHSGEKKGFRVTTKEGDLQG